VRSSLLIVVLATCLGIACKNDEQPPPEEPKLPICDQDFVLRERVCVPRFGSCRGMEAPLLGGKCVAVGSACPFGFNGSGDGGCKSNLPPCLA